jgi:hypothetical protein
MLCGLPEKKRRARHFMSFQAFLDDSGSGAPVFVLSGYVSSVDVWEIFSEQWQELLDESPKLKYFKMREAASRSGEFRGIKLDNRNERVGRFFRLIREATQASVSCVIPIAPYNRLVKGKIKKEWDDPYFIALFDLVIYLVETHFQQRAAGKTKGVLDFIFDDNPRLAAKVPYWYQLTRDMLPSVVRDTIGASPRFENDHDFLPLQAADAQAWYYRRLFAEKFHNEPFKNELPKSLFHELDRIPAMMAFWSSERLAALAAQRPLSSPQPDQRFKDIHDLIANAEMM